MHFPFYIKAQRAAVTWNQFNIQKENKAHSPLIMYIAAISLLH